MGAQCFKSGNNGVDLRDEKTKREYYLNMVGQSDNNEIGAPNYDITEQRLIGYGTI